MNRRISDSGALKRSKPGQMLEEGLHDLSAPEPLPGRSLPTGDVAFALQPNLMKPFSRKYLDLLTRICDYRFSRARRISADVLGIITNLWRVYSYPISLRLEKVRELTVIVLKLHNWLRSGQSKTVYMPPVFCDTYDQTIQSFIPSSCRKENNHNYLIQP